MPRRDRAGCEQCTLYLAGFLITGAAELRPLEFRVISARGQPGLQGRARRVAELSNSSKQTQHRRSNPKNVWIHSTNAPACSSI
jgi:hypothetical protein